MCTLGSLVPSVSAISVLPCVAESGEKASRVTVQIICSNTTYIKKKKTWHFDSLLFLNGTTQPWGFHHEHHKPHQCYVLLRYFRSHFTLLQFWKRDCTVMNVFWKGYFKRWLLPTLWRTSVFASTNHASWKYLESKYTVYNIQCT